MFFSRQAGRAELGPESPGVSDSFHFFIMVVRYVARVSKLIIHSFGFSRSGYGWPD